MTTIFEILIPIVGISAIWFIEYRNPLWKKFVAVGGSPVSGDFPMKSTQMLFFWESAETPKMSLSSDYWNAMEISATNDGVVIRRPPLMYGRRSVFYSWPSLRSGKSFRCWLQSRRALAIVGTDLHFAVTESFFKKHVQPYVQSAN